LTKNKKAKDNKKKKKPKKCLTVKTSQVKKGLAADATAVTARKDAAEIVLARGDLTTI
jgi:hypothetical protein